MQFAIDITLFLFYFLGFLLVCAWTWRFWMMYVNQKFLNKLNNDSIMLEIKLPREIKKSPLAMETALAAFIQGGGVGNKYSRLWAGNLPTYSSLEIASIEGVIHFYVRIDKKFKPLIESNFYAQYPGIEIVPVDDYTSRIRYHHLTKDVSCWGAYFTLGEKWTPTNPEEGEPFKKDGKDYKMRADFFPIKTYVDYGLDKDPDEEFKTDPITPLLEFMGSVGKGENVWYQIIVQAESSYDGIKFPKLYVNEVTHEHFSLSDMAKNYKKQLRTAGWQKKGETEKDAYGDPISKKYEIEKDAEGKPEMGTKYLVYGATKAIPKKETELTPEEKDEIDTINRKLSKPLVNVVMRLLYVTKRDSFNPAHIQHVIAHPKPYTGSNSLSMSPFDPYDYPWQKFGGKVEWRTEENFEAYVEREGFYPHIPPRKNLNDFEDSAFRSTTLRNRRLFRMIYEAIFYPFSHPHPKEVFTLNLEELATLWHFPGAVAGTPTLPRIDSVKGVAPTNLPV